MTTAAAGFGAAMATLYVVPELHADIIELNFTPESIPANSFYPQQVFVDELALRFSQWNDGAGKTMYAGSLTSINVVSKGTVLSTGKFSGGFTINFTAFQLSSSFVGFRSAGNVGWFKLDLGGNLGPISYLEGQYGNAGEDVVVGGVKVLLGDVNCDGLVNLLDVQPFVTQLQSGEYLEKADMNEDGSLDLLDIDGFVAALNE